METKTIIPNLNELNIPRFNLAPQASKSYYRSKIFTSHIGINPLITAASPLFSMIEKLKKTEEAPELSKLHFDLIHEIKAFENKTQALGYRSPMIHAARYLLCTWLDEIIFNSSWITPQEWEKRTLLNNFQQGTSYANNQFFSLLDHCKQDASLYIDLLEMMYLCLCLGYEGEYRFMDHGVVQLNKMKDDLYECIHLQRGDFSKKLEICLAEPKTKTPKSFFHYLPFGLCVLATAAFLIGFYVFFDQQLDRTTQVAYQSLQSLMKPPVSEKSI